MESPTEAETNLPQSTTRNASFFCIMCQKLFAEGKDGSSFDHYTTWTALIESAALGCILCSQMMSALLEDRQEELLPRFKEDVESNDAKLQCQLENYPHWTLWVFGHDRSGLLNSKSLKKVASATFWVYETSKFRNSYTASSSMDDPIETTTQRTDNERTWQTVSRWLSDCSSNHETCNSSSAETLWMPSRVIDVLAGQSSDIKEDRIRLITTKDLSLLSKYATLSHCWGGQVPVQLNKETRSQLNSGYPVDSLPQTFADAVRITRRLGVKYVWIDSLCIEQDSEEDWRKESQAMDQVYSRSWCNIAASASKDSSVGCFFDWSAKFAQPFEADISWTANSSKTKPNTFVPHFFFRDRIWDTYVDEAVLYQRAWVMQERILPVRQLNFTKAGVFWECRCLDANQYLDAEKFDYRSSYKRFSTLLEELTTKLPPRPGFDRDEAIRETYVWWNIILQSYSRVKLSKVTDRLVAISGLAKRMQAALNDEYLAGLWKHRFLNQLCWMAEPDSEKAFNDARRPRPLLAPTWSWASLLQPIHTRSHEEISPLAEVLEVNLQYLTEDSTGEVVGGYLRLRAFLGPVDLSRKETGAVWRFSFHAWMIHASGTLDEELTEQDIDGEFFCVPLYWDTCYIHGILLRSTCGGQDGYERIGYWAGSFKGDSVDDQIRMAESWINELRDVSEKRTAPSYQDIVIY